MNEWCCLSVCVRQVVEPHWQELLVALGTRVANVDDVLRLHGEFQV